MSHSQSASESFTKKKEFSLGEKCICVCLLIPHKRTVQTCSPFIHKQRQTFSLLCRLLLSPCFSFSLPLQALEDCTQTPRNKPGGPQTTHRAGSRSFFSPASSVIPNILVYGHFPFSIFIYPSYFSFLFHMFLQSWPKICMTTLPCFHLHSSNLFHFVCLNILM